MKTTHLIFILVASALVFISLSLFIYGIIAAKIIKHEKFDLKVADNSKFKGMNILFFSDLHLGKLLKKSEINKIFAKINLANIDIVIFGGDLFGEKFTKHYSKKDINEIFSVFNNIKHRYAIIGNHETKLMKKKMTLEESLEYLDATGFTILKNHAVVIEKENQKMVICGLDENHRGSPDIVKSLETIPNYDMLLVAIHQPDYFDNLLSYKPNLVLSGHSHGGQITLFGKRFHIIEGTSKYYRGVYKRDNSNLIVTNGIGNNLLKMRLFSPPNLYIIRVI